MKIVSANYRDRDSAERWLIRDKSEHPDQAQAFKEVRAQGGVAFCPSSDFERGFGCSTVAFCEEAVGTNESSPESLLEGKARIYFEYYQFKDEKGEIVSECQELLLRADGSMYALL